MVVTITTEAVVSAKKAKNPPEKGRDAVLNTIAANTRKRQAVGTKRNPAEGQSIVHGMEMVELEQSGWQPSPEDHPSDQQKGAIFTTARALSKRDQRIFRAMIHAQSELYPRVRPVFEALYPKETMVSDKTFYDVRDEIKKRFGFLDD